MNTIFNYLYRDASNYKNWGSVTFQGEYTPEQEGRMKNAFDMREFFIADQVDVDEVFFTYGELSKEDDHCWHEFDSLELTNEEATDERTFEEFVRDVEEASRLGWKEFDNNLGTHK